LTSFNGRKIPRITYSGTLASKELQVEINEKEKVAKVFVAPEELSLAIGRDGQNVRLASN